MMAVVLIALTLPGAAIAADANMATRMQEAHLTPGIMFSLLFLMIGPIKILLPFAPVKPIEEAFPEFIARKGRSLL
jgi:hypothetical protein